MNEEFEKRTQSIIAAYPDEELLMEFEVVNQIMEIDNWYESVLQEVIDLTRECLLEECTRRFTEGIKNRKGNIGKLVVMSGGVV